MILGMDVLRWLTTRVIQGKTWVGQSVYDSPAQPADLRMQADQAPFVAVYTDDADVDARGDGQRMTGGTIALGRTLVYLVIECAVGEKVIIADPSEEQVVDTGTPADHAPIELAETDAAREMAIGFIARQVNQAFLATDNQWAELWRQLVVEVHKVEIRRGGQTVDADQKAVRFASRVMRYTIEILNDPVWGQAVPEGFWANYLAAIAAAPDMADVAELIRTNIEYPTGPLPSWRIAQKLLMATREEIGGLGISIPIIPDETEAPMGVRGTVHDEDDAKDFVTTEAEPAGDIETPPPAPETYVEQPLIVDETPPDEATP